jgi:hypothetical protein
MPLRLQFRLCGSVTFRRLAGANAGRLPSPQQLTQDEKAAIAAFKKMANQIADIKETHKRQAMRRPEDWRPRTNRDPRTPKIDRLMNGNVEYHDNK